jgi:hypothetical protein
MRHLLSAFFLLTTTLTLHAQPPSYVPTDGLVGWWPFNGNANDESGNGNNGTVNGATLTQDRFGNADEAYLFDGNDKIEVDNWNALVGNTEFTVSCWVKQENGLGWVLAFGQPANGQGFSMGNYHWGQNNIGGQIWSYDYITSVSTSIEISSWQQIVFVYSQNIMYLYYNGIVSSNAPVDYVNTDLQPGILSLGKQLVFNEYFNGEIDDLAIYNRALTPAEIQALYTGQPLTPCISPDPVSFTGLGTSYTTSDGPVTLTGSPAGGVFIGPGVTGSTFTPAVAGEGTHGVTYMYEDEQGCLNAASLCTSVSLGMGLEPGGMLSGGVKVFPNPNRGHFTVELELAGLVSMQVFDARGALVHNEVFTATGARTQRSLDLSAFAKGSYTLLVEHDGQRVSQAVVVE